MTFESQPGALGRVQTVGIVARAQLPDAATVVANITQWLSARGVATVIETETAQAAGRDDAQTYSRTDIPEHVDLLLVLGGDGTLLGVAGAVASANRDIPVLAVNFGSLGFLTEITFPELYRSLESVLDGKAGVDERGMLHSQVRRDDAVVADKLVLNDVVIGRAALSNIIELAVTVGEQFVTSFRADGLIVATPTGSTAHSLAAGGPIVHPLVDAMILTPIAPHTLTNRPVVIPSTTAVHVRPTLVESHHAAYVSFDGQSGLKLTPGDVITIQRAARPLKVVRAESRNYFAVLREKLKWGQQ